MAELLVRLLGTFQVQQGEVEISRFRGDKVRALLAYLAVESDRPHSRAALAGLLWPDLPDAPALRNLTQAVVRLREALGTDVLETTRQDVRWRREVAEVDVTTATLLAYSSDLADLVRAADLYRGEFLAGFRLADCSECEDFEAWMLLTRERLLQQALTVLQTAASAGCRASG